MATSCNRHPVARRERGHRLHGEGTAFIICLCSLPTNERCSRAVREDVTRALLRVETRHAHASPSSARWPPPRRRHRHLSRSTPGARGRVDYPTVLKPVALDRRVATAPRSRPSVRFSSSRHMSPTPCRGPHSSRCRPRRRSRQHAARVGRHARGRSRPPPRPPPPLSWRRDRGASVTRTGTMIVFACSAGRSSRQTGARVATVSGAASARFIR